MRGEKIYSIDLFSRFCRSGRMLFASNIYLEVHEANMRLYGLMDKALPS